MPWTDDALNDMVSAANVTHAAIFNGDPSDGGTQIGDRLPVSLSAASAGSREVTDDVVFDTSQGDSVNHVAYFSDATGGSLRYYEARSQTTFGEAGTYTIEAGSRIYVES